MKEYDEKQRIVIEKYLQYEKASKNLYASRTKYFPDMPEAKQRQLKSSMELGGKLYELIEALVNMEDDEDKKRKRKIEFNTMFTEGREND